MSTFDPAVVRAFLNDMHRTAYGAGLSLSDLHDVEDQAAAYLGVRVIRAGQPDLVTPAQLHSLCYAAVAEAEALPRAAGQKGGPA